jgi:hypothetical protein
MGAGRPLDTSTRGGFERLYPVDLSQVRVHDDSASSAIASGLRAAAVTVSDSIYLDRSAVGNSGGTREHVIRHEVAHVVQSQVSAQSGRAPVSRPLRLDRHSEVSASSDAAEINAERISAGVTAGRAVPVVAPTPNVIPRFPPLASAAGRRTVCLAPSEIVNAATAGKMGKPAEIVIEADYCSKLGPCTIMVTDFFDLGGWRSPYIAFLAANNPSLSVTGVAIQTMLAGGVVIPDIVTHKPGRTEYYEIKPNSPDGRLAGAGKMAALAAFMSYNKLPYTPGTAYVPTPRIPIPGAGALVLATLNLPALAACGAPDIAFGISRPAPGLLLYELCITADFECIAKVVALEVFVAVAIAAILALLAGGAVAAPAAAPVLAGAAVL